MIRLRGGSFHLLLAAAITLGGDIPAVTFSLGQCLRLKAALFIRENWLAREAKTRVLLVKHNISRLAEDHKKAKSLASVIAEIPSLEIDMNTGDNWLLAH